MPCSRRSSTPAMRATLVLTFLDVLLLLLLLLLLLPGECSAQSRLCRTSCGSIPINYPFGLDDGCGSPYYHRLLVCSPSPSSSTLHLRTPSGTYRVVNISYTDPHLIVSDPSMWTCASPTSPLAPSPPPHFTLDTSTHLSLSPRNDYLFLNCSPDAVISGPKSEFCDRFPDQCPAVCDSSAYLCRNPPECPEALTRPPIPCCSYSPKAAESVRLMLEYCTTYATVYWRTATGDGRDFRAVEQVPEYGVRVDFEMPVTTSCLQCEDVGRGGGGVCGFDVGTRDALCLCAEGNATAGAHCGDDDGITRHKSSAGVIAGTTVVVSIAGVATAGVLVWYLRKLRTNRVACGVQSNVNRMF